MVTVKKDNEAAFRLVIEGLGAIPVFPMDHTIDYSNLLLIIRLRVEFKMKIEFEFD